MLCGDSKGGIALCAALPAFASDVTLNFDEPTPQPVNHHAVPFALHALQ